MIVSPFIRKLTAVVVVLNLFVIGMTGWWLQHSLEQTREDALNIVENLAEVLQASLTGTIRNIDLGLLTVADQYRRQGASPRIDEKAINDVMAEQLGHLPELESLRMTDAKGSVRYGIGANPTTNLSDRDFFAAALGNPQAGMIVGKPVFARIAKKWVIVFARRVETADGGFAGVVYGNIALEKLASHFQAIRIGQSGSVSLRDANLGVIVRVPEALPTEQAIGNRKVSANLEEMVRAGKGSGSYIAKTSYDAVERAAAYRRLDPYPLYVTIGFAEEDFLAPWRQERLGGVIAVMLFLVVTLSSAWLLARTWRVQERTADELARSKEDLELRVAERTEQLEAANRELEEFSYSMSHDMSTPLRAINGYSRLLLEEHQDRLDDEGRRLLVALGSNAGRMGRLIDDILRFLGMGRRKLRPASFEMAGLVQESFDVIRRARPDRAMRLEMTALPDVWGDADMLMVALREMLSNAVKYTPADREALVEVEGREEDGATLYCVRDHGVGFDMRFADKLFKVFERVHGTGEYEGTGIGLAIAKRVVERHGGRIWAEGTVGGGATFWFSLPRRGQPGAVQQTRSPASA